MFRKVLIANRGEIARRVIRTCQRLGIATVAVYSDADADALHVREADEAVRIGPPPVAQSYLQVNAIVQAARDTGADAVHPGYGLLSEQPAFARAVREAGIKFIGPSADAIAAMGSKIAARSMMKTAGVPIVPGTEGAVDLAEALSFAEQIGYPVMLKAAHGGGGIGMQVVHNADELSKVFTSNQSRAKAYFGNGEMFVEKVVESPRHIEIQVLFDEHGNGVFLWERECSVQRRHQKVIEEAPSSFVDDELRQAMGQAALKAAQTIGYSNAGTVEFLVDSAKQFYFLEMNTRLQVEHPVTEMITGLDLVELQLQIADGALLPFAQSDVPLVGHAIECRVYAEDPEKMLPSPGTIEQLTLPTGEGVRNDVGVESGSKVTPYYDPMIGKLIVHAPSRSEAIRRMADALSSYTVTGIKTNLPLLRKVIDSDAFARGDTTTDFLHKWF
ncbi:acetyl/propionyl/methylcrotonyl-CoA carboxylase subunit alpha [Alicyclobacillus pomorum]|jgi:acetyl-CoA carboxylase, biotin carboxylase subunit|uniref:acetyl-CoA carboxylase biotin carboxylase subunit n=1 Tax=Alicyclobacillus pomorum TaxID=204470 RepID=UPI0004199B99|nr:acetyl-CoA carboxylase biotin carboxylase subunit [Alicyclobacillus pomorum]